MAFDVTAYDETGSAKVLHLDRYPDQCPACKRHINPNPLPGHFVSRGKNQIRIPFVCPVLDCQEVFIAAYARGADIVANGLCKLSQSALLRSVREQEFPETVRKVSELFCQTYNQALTAEGNSLDQIAGPGFRKALEFLIKDFLIQYKFKDKPEMHEAIRQTFLGKCIEQYIDEDRIKHCAKRAAWLGNDETHYARKWETKDIQDLKSLVTMTVNWIDLVIQSDEYISSMPEG
jgi:hypothetical protein